VAAAEVMRELKQKAFGAARIDEFGDPFLIVGSLVNPGVQDCEAFAQQDRADMIFLLDNNFKVMSQVVWYLKKLLKQPDFSKFDEVFQQIMRNKV